MTTAFPAREAGLLGAAFFVAVFLVFSLRSDVFVHGDIGTDGRAVIGAEQFRRLGVRALLNTQTVDGRAEIGLRPSYYPRHPSGGVIALARLRDWGFGYPAARFLPLLATTLGLLGFAACCFRISGDARFALIAGTAYAAFAPHYLLADSFQLYSYALFAKGVGAWCIAEAAAATGRRRLLFAAGAAASAFSGVAFFGLETMPALGLLSVVLPAIAFPGGIRSRFVATLVVGGATGAGMAAGVAYRVSEMAPIFGDSAGAALEHLAASTASRSFRTIETGLGGVDYVVEVCGRIWSYAPVHLSVAAIGAVVSLAFGRRIASASSTRLWLRAALVFALAELPYFILMRRHVALHVHTLAHLGFVTAGIAACGWLALDERFRSPRSRRAVAAIGALLVLLSLAVSPLVVKGNLLIRGQLKNLAAADRDAQDIISGAPRDAVLFIAPQDRDWQLREAASRDGRMFVASDDLRRPSRSADDAAYVASVASRPVYAVVSTKSGDPEFARYAARGVQAAANRRHVLFALEPASPNSATSRPKLASRGDRSELGGPALSTAKLVAPTTEAIAAAKLGHPLFRFSDGALWMHAAPPALGAATTVELPWAPAADAAAMVVAEVFYKPAGTQPALELELTATDATNSAAAPRRAVVFRPSESKQTLELYLPPGSAAAGLRFRLSLAAGETRETAARLLVRRIRIVPRG